MLLGSEEDSELNSISDILPKLWSGPHVVAATRNHHRHLLAGSLDIMLGRSVGGGGLVSVLLVTLVVHDLELAVGTELSGVQLSKLIAVGEGWWLITEDDCQEGDLRQGVHCGLSRLEAMAEI